MQFIFAFVFALFGVQALVQQGEEATAENTWRVYVYIAIGAVVLIVVAVVLTRRQHRKFNE